MELLTLTSLTTQLPLQSGLPYNVLAAMNATAGGLLGRPMNTINLSDVVYGMRNIPQYIFSDYTLTTIIVRQMLYLSRVLSTLSTEVLGPNDNRYWNTHSAAQMRSLGQIATLVMVIAFYDPYPGVYLGEYGNIIVIPGPRIPQDPANLLARLSVALHAVVNTPSFIFWSNGATMENLKMLYHTGSGQEFKDLIIRAVQTGLLSRILAAGSMNFNSLWPVSP
jgi:hypothetical protein